MTRKVGPPLHLANFEAVLRAALQPPAVCEVPKHLYQCTTVDLQTAWIKRALLAGRVLSDSGLWLGGVDHPERIIKKLRAAGMAVETTKKKVVDAAGEEHNDLAWRITEGTPS